MNFDDALALLDRARADAEAAIAAASTVDALDAVEREWLGKRSPATAVNEAIKTFTPEERPRAGQAVGGYRSAVGEAAAARREALAAAAAADRGPGIDLTLGGHARPRGHLHLVTQIRRELEDIFIGLGYRVAEGPEVEDDWHNFEALNIPPAHPARSMQDTIYVDLGAEEQMMLRTHTSPVQIRTM